MGHNETIIFILQNSISLVCAHVKEIGMGGGVKSREEKNSLIP